MLTWFYSAISARTPAPPLAVDEVAASAELRRDDDRGGLRLTQDAAAQLQALAASCADGLAALAYAQFADGLEPARRDAPPAKRSR
jgi:hypothetical protein